MKIAIKEAGKVLLKAKLEDQRDYEDSLSGDVVIDQKLKLQSDLLQ